ncbi:MAG: hypothetical protein Q9201_005122 [Fulgogasparrea decipioides]
MSGKSPGGFADLRAKFETKANDESPPSRGRSPAGKESVTGGSGRKIRTSFISVERSGQMGPPVVDQDNSKGSNDDQKSVTRDMKEPAAEVNGEESEFPHTNGDAAPPVMTGDVHGPDDKPPEPALDTSADSSTLEQGKAMATDAVNPDKPRTAEEDNVPSMQPSDPKDENAVSGGAALAPKGESLGALLKGSDFQPEENGSSKASSPKKSPKKSAAPSIPSTQSKKTKVSRKSTPGQPKAGETPKINGSPRSKEEPTPKSTMGLPQALPGAKRTGTSVPTAESSAEAPKTPTSPNTTKTPVRQPLQKTTSPGQSLQSKDGASSADNNREKTNVQRPTRPSIGTKSAQPIGRETTKPTSSAPPKKPSTGSPTTTKPKPKSPTRPVRLPGAATASTAASAAKAGSTAPPRPESRTGISNPTRLSTSNKPIGTQGRPKSVQPNASNLRLKAPRSSLPASTTDQKPRPKPRTSTASTKAVGGDFLARMMRPTQSSASKTHEKVEQKTPPKKRLSARPKKVSDENDKEAENNPVEVKPETDQQAQVQETSKSNLVEPTVEAVGAAEEIPKELRAEETLEPSADDSVPQASQPVSAQ